MTQQVAVALGTGNIAAVMIDQYLRKQDVARRGPARPGMYDLRGGYDRAP